METKTTIASTNVQTNEAVNEYTTIVNSEEFKLLMKRKKTFIIPCTIFFLCFYFALPLMTSNTTFLTKAAVGSITWAWIFAFLQFIMTWGLCMLYYKKAGSFDELSEKILKKLGR